MVVIQAAVGRDVQGARRTLQQALTEGIRRALATESEQVAPKVRVYAERYLSLEKIMRSFELSFL